MSITNVITKVVDWYFQINNYYGFAILLININIDIKIADEVHAKEPVHLRLV